jgi:hypothetical protein
VHQVIERIISFMPTERTKDDAGVFVQSAIAKATSCRE